MRRAPLRNPCLKSNFMLAVWRAQAEVKFPHPANWRERNDWAWYLRQRYMRHRAARGRFLPVDERGPNENAGTRPALGSTIDRC